MRKDLLRTSDLTAEEVQHVLELAAQYKKEPYRGREILQNDTVVLYFNKPSTRTRISFETAVARLGGVPIMVRGEDLQLGRGETIEDTAQVMSRYVRAVVIRTYRDADLLRFAGAATVPVINALTDDHHPCQSLADLLTLSEKGKTFSTSKLAYIGDGNNVCHSLLEAAALVGLTIAVATPAEFAPQADVLDVARNLATATGAQITIGSDPVAAAKDADAIYTDAWLSMGDPAEEREKRFAAFRRYQVNATLIAHAKPDAIFLHCLPEHRGEEVTAEVVDGPRSVVFDQAENRLHTSVAILDALVSGKLEGRGGD